MKTLTATTGLITLRRCPVRWCAYFGDDVPTNHTHHSDQPPITLAIEGGAAMPEEFRDGDTSDCFEPVDYALASVITTLVQPFGEAPHVTIGAYHVESTDAPRFTLDEVEQLRDQLDALIELAERRQARATNRG